MNCDRSRNSRKTPVNPAVFASSRAASTSSRRQNGLGFERKIARSKATAVEEVFRRRTLAKCCAVPCLAGGRAPQCRSPIRRFRPPRGRRGLAAAEQLAEQVLKIRANQRKRVCKQLPAVAVDAFNDLLQGFFECGPSRRIGFAVRCRARSTANSCNESQLTAPESAELSPEFLDFLLGVRGQGS